MRRAGGEFTVAETGARFARHLAVSGLIAPRSTVLVALSGGIDSMVLLHLLRSLPAPWKLELHAAHFDHRMRPESGADAAWVRGVCRAWEVPVTIGAARGELHGQAAARAARYEFLEETATRIGADRIATAHQADDQSETVLFRIARGTGLRGLAGIPPRRGRIVRPLLPFDRAEIEEYARRWRVPYREDPTNIGVDYTRNYLRHEVLPRLERVAPGAARSLRRLAAHAREEVELRELLLDTIEPRVVEYQNDDLIELARGALLSYHPRVRGALLRRLVRRLGSSPGRAATRILVEFAETARSGSRIDIAGGIRAEREFDHLRIWRVSAGEDGQGVERPLLIPGPDSGEGEAVLGGDLRLSVRWILGRAEESAAAAAFAPSDLRFPLEVRGWRPGDRIQLPYGTKKLKKLFAEHRVGRAERSRIPILAEVGGRVLWVVGLARAAVATPVAGEPAFHIEVVATESSGSRRGTLGDGER